MHTSSAALPVDVHNTHPVLLHCMQLHTKAIISTSHIRCTQALKRFENVALADSERIVTDVDALIESFGPRKALDFVVEVQVAPSVSWKGPYTGLTVRTVATAVWITKRAHLCGSQSERICVDHKASASVLITNPAHVCHRWRWRMQGVRRR